MAGKDSLNVRSLSWSTLMFLQQLIATVPFSANAYIDLYAGPDFRIDLSRNQLCVGQPCPIPEPLVVCDM